MGVTEDIHTFASIYHNNKDIKVECVIYNNVKNTGNSYYKYEDKREEDIVHFEGQKKGRDDHLMIGGSSLYLERISKYDVYRYIGLVTNVELVERNIDAPNIYKLRLDRNHIHNGYKSGDKLNYVDGIPRGCGKFCIKNSSLHRLSLTGEGSMMSGIIKTMPEF